MGTEKVMHICFVARREKCRVQSDPMSSNDNDITPAILLRHMQAMEGRMRTDFSNAILASEDRLRTDFSRKIEATERNIIRQIDAVDGRLDDLEVVEVPALKKAVGMK